ncbi:Acg family FMN-binding oxidoreductase [Pedobacter jamesrossensis]|uniref:Acg family FMN-binding oxidoreductase n=1 Tax=Pedobacter jamesrossensis TaxID=1908238 RepID=A0ABV8NJG7_9SPHI
MKRRTFLGLAGGTVLAVGGIGYLTSDKSNYVRADITASTRVPLLKPVEQEILYLASLAPSGHNTQPWFVKHLAAFHWIICNDKSKWLPAVDPSQRETILSIGAFMQNLEYAASYYGYRCDWKMLADTNQTEKIMEVTLIKAKIQAPIDISKIISRRTIRSNYLNEPIKPKDLQSLSESDENYFHYFSRDSKEFSWLNKQTLAANQQQTYRNDAEKELGKWLRFSSKEARHYKDGLTTASMEIIGISGWFVRNFYTSASAMKDNFREQSLEKVKTQVSQSAGWLLITSKDSSTIALLETGKRLQRLLLEIREKQIAIHPMTQILEEQPFSQKINEALGIVDHIQFILRCGYIKEYPEPVSLRRPVSSFVKS